MKKKIGVYSICGVPMEFRIDSSVEGGQFSLPSPDIPAGVVLIGWHNNIAEMAMSLHHELVEMAMMINGHSFEPLHTMQPSTQDRMFSFDHVEFSRFDCEVALCFLNIMDELHKLHKQELDKCRKTRSKK